MKAEGMIGSFQMKIRALGLAFLLYIVYNEITKVHAK
jgi:hypothetical protein